MRCDELLLLHGKIVFVFKNKNLFFYLKIFYDSGLILWKNKNYI